MVLVAVRDLLFASKIDAAARRVGASIGWAPRDRPLSAAAAESRPAAVLVDLGQAGILGELRAVLADRPETRVVGFLGHLQADLMEEARSMGVAEVLTRGQLAASLDDVLLRFGG